MPPADRIARCAVPARRASVPLLIVPMLLAGLAVVLSGGQAAAAGLTTWDGRWPIERITATFVYFVPADRPPLPDWRHRPRRSRRGPGRPRRRDGRTRPWRCVRPIAWPMPSW